ncbi:MULTISPECIES: Eco57I restriction-modification methylase domain-containing protein [Psychrilyobacter]|nr:MULTISPECIES: TaqI-like C-terminal specificity domain-containing protein [Psychrilyobacter]MCS5422843.1 Eco57I restriction-modification methylase domain-containing protein [Psychrilyobacter sp. S5]
MKINSDTNFKVYTPDYIAKEMINKSLDIYFNGDYSRSKFDNLRCADLSCGTGNLLLPLLNTIIQLYKAKLGEYTYNISWITGYDIDGEALLICKNNILKILEKYEIEDKNINLIKTNSLMEEIDETYDLVLGNPPYFGEKNNKEIFEDMKKYKFGKENYEGKMDYAYFFIAKGIDALKDGGVLTYITTNYWFKADHAKKLREKIKKYTTFKYINNYNRSVFEEAAGQHNVVFTLRKEKKSGKLEVIDDREKYFIDSDKIYNYRDKVILAKEEDLERLNRVYNGRTHFLGELLNINQGIVSGYDRAFVFDSYEENYREYLKPFYKNKDIDQYTYTSNKYWILYLDNKVALNKKLAKHLNPHKERLSRRREVLRSIINWWELQWARDEKIFNVPKIIGRQRSKINKFSYSEGEFYGSADIYYLTPREKNINLFYILGYLNSKVFYDWFKYNGKMKGDNLELYATPLKETPIYYTKDKAEIAYIEKLVKKQIEHYEEKTQKLIDRYFSDLKYGI